jgi:ankyrin repeat protein
VFESVKLLLKLGADINAVDDNGETVMHGAAYRNHPKLVQLLAERGCKIAVWNKANKAGLTPLVIAEGHRPGLNFRPSPETVSALQRVLRAAGATPLKHPALSFEQRVLPLLQRKCFACHGADPKKIKGALDLHTRAGMLKGGKSGAPALVPGDTAEIDNLLKDPLAVIMSFCCRLYGLRRGQRKAKEIKEALL